MESGVERFDFNYFKILIRSQDASRAGKINKPIQALFYMKSLKPTMREKKRYLLVRGQISDIEKAIRYFIGVLGMSKAALVWIKKDKDKAIISVNRGSVDHVRASFAVWPQSISVARVSGTLKGLRKV